MNGYTSKSREITCGVPQGPILGPLLFLIYINDLPSCLKHANRRMYADDANLTITDLENLKLWPLANKLNLNVAETEYMLVGSRCRVENANFAPSLRVGSSGIKRVQLVNRSEYGLIKIWHAQIKMMLLRRKSQVLLEVFIDKLDLLFL